MATMTIKKSPPCTYKFVSCTNEDKDNGNNEAGDDWIPSVPYFRAVVTLSVCQQNCHQSFPLAIFTSLDFVIIAHDGNSQWWFVGTPLSMTIKCLRWTLEARWDMLRAPKNVPDWTVFWLHDTACWAMPALGRLWPTSDDDENQMYSICMLAGVL